MQPKEAESTWKNIHPWFRLSVINKISSLEMEQTSAM